MTERAIKTRVLTKVRKQYLQKYPTEEEELAQNTSLLLTPEQINGDTGRLLEQSLGLVEANRNINVGYQFINSYYRIENLRIEKHFESRIVTLDLKYNDADILPWQYCVKRLESYGDLELATWASRLRAYHENYPIKMQQYFEKMRDPQISAAIEKGKEEAMLKCKELERKNAFVKVGLYGNKDSMYPVSLTFNEEMLNGIEHSPESFMEWVKEHGIPGVFGKDSSMLKAYCQKYLEGSGMKQAFFQEGPEYEVDVYNKEKQKKKTKVGVYYTIQPAAEGVFVNVYVVKKENEVEISDNINKETENKKQIKEDYSDDVDKDSKPETGKN